MKRSYGSMKEQQARPPRSSKRKASSQTVGSGKKKKLIESSTKVTAVSETSQEYSTSRCNSHFMTRKTMHNFRKDLIMFNTNQSSYTVVKHSWLTRWRPILTVSRLGVFPCFISTEANKSLYQQRKPYMRRHIQCYHRQSTTFVNSITCEQNTLIYDSLRVLLYAVCLYGVYRVFYTLS